MAYVAQNMEIQNPRGVKNVPDQTIHVPFNESTVHIYEAYIKVAKEIAARNQITANTAPQSSL